MRKMKAWSYRKIKDRWAVMDGPESIVSVLHPGDEAESDAKLMAAAPSLLFAIKLASNALESMDPALLISAKAKLMMAIVMAESDSEDIKVI